MVMILWLISCVPLVGTSVALLFIPDRVPMHYDITGSVDRWGSKYEELIFPVIVLAFALFWTLLIIYYKKHVRNAGSDSQKTALLKNVRIFQITGICMAAAFAILQGFLLYNAGRGALTGGEHEEPDILRVVCIILGVLYIILGCLMPRTTVNRIFGVRVSWSMYNNVTWSRTNQFGGYAMIAAGIISVICACMISDSFAAFIAVVAVLIAASIVILIYAHHIYKKEVSKA